MTWFPEIRIKRIVDVKVGNQYWFKDYFVDKIKLTLLAKMVKPAFIYDKLPLLVWYHEKLGYLIGRGNDAEHTNDLHKVHLDELKELVKIIEENETN
jgi:hypothetical protein